MLTASTELEAVNHMLTNMGEAPVDTLEGELPLDALKARQKLLQVLEHVLTRGWYWNTEEFNLSPDAAGEIYVPSGTLSISLADRNDYTVTIRGGKLYRIQAGNNGTIFDSPQRVKLVFFLNFEDLPPVARQYVTRRAAREYQVQELGDQLIVQQDTDEEARAWVTMVAEDNRASQRTLKNSTDLQMILGRNRRRY